MLGLITRFLIVINVVLVTACDSSTPNDVADDTIKNQNTEFLDTPQKDKQIVARIGMQAITLDKVDERIKLGLYDLDRQRYELRKAELKRIVEHELTQQSVSQSLTAELLLAPPLPPRLLVPFGERPVKGNVQAEVQLQIFCSYQSSHCARLQPVISQLDALYSIHLNIRYYDLPQSFHRNGHTSANAVRCASEQTMPWSFQNSIYSAVDQLNEDRYRIIAEQLGLDLREFSTCLTEQRYFDAINRDIKLGQSLGFGNVPVVLVNGLYLNGALPLEVYEYYINQELMRLGIELTSKEATLSSLPIRLLATSLNNESANSTAIIEYIKTADIRTFKQEEYLQDGVLLIEIKENKIVINNKGVREFIRMQSSRYQDEEKNSLQDDQTEAMPANTQESDAGESFQPKIRTIPAQGELTLSREWVDEQLENQEALELYFKSAEHVVEGHHLMRLESVGKEVFYKALGFESGDVIMRVGDEWVHEGQNPLWNNLESEEAFTVILMRKGLPVRFDYKIEDVSTKH